MCSDKIVSIIWNLTRLCSWNCRFCCVDAKYISNLRQVNVERNVDYSYKNELCYKDKIRVINQLTCGKYKIDFSGGELLIDPLNVHLILHASERLGSENVGISTSGAFLTDDVIEKLSGKVRDVEFTLDYLPFRPYKLRPIGYHEYASYSINRLVSRNFRVGVQTVITRENISKKKISEMYNWLIENKVHEWSLLRFFPSGRGMKHSDYVPSHNEYCSIVDYIKKISNNSTLEVSFQYLLPNHDNHTYSCRAVKKSIGILPDGSITACFWALNNEMMPQDDIYYLGSIAKDNIEDILNNYKSKYWKDKEHKCKIFTCEAIEEGNIIKLYSC